MKKTFIIIGVIFAVCISFAIGLLVGQYNKAKTDLLIRKAEGTTFYAKIDSIRENNGTIHISATGVAVCAILLIVLLIITGYLNPAREDKRPSTIPIIIGLVTILKHAFLMFSFLSAD